MPSKREFALRLAFALLKHGATKVIGDDAVDVVAEEAVDAGEEELLGRLDAWLNKPATEKQLGRVIAVADDCFAESPILPAAREALTGVDLTGEPALHEAINRLPKTGDEAALRRAIVQTVKGHTLPISVSDAALEKAVDEYVRCLRKGLLSLKEVGESVVRRAVLGIEEELRRQGVVLDEIREDTRRIPDIQRTVTELRRELVDSVARLAPDHAVNVQRFLEEYLGTAGRKVPFGGRDAQLEALDAWLLEDGAPPYALIAAPAGRGKSALLVQWAQGVEERGLAHVVFAPISLRFQTAEALTTYQILAARLGEIYEEPQKYAERPAAEWRQVYHSFLRQEPPAGEPVLVIVDGLDEAAGEQAGPALLPLEPAAGVRAVVSARLLAGDVGEEGWRRRLGWEHDEQARTIDLPLLTEAGVRDVLREMGDPLAQLATDVDTTAELFRLSEGDPLLVRLYVEALLPADNREAFIRPEQLPDIKPGLKAYFERWWKDQERQWAAQGEDPLAERAGAETFFNLCAAALGPLTRDDVLALDPETFSSGMAVKRTADTLARFIVGDGQEQGYVFSHPRLAQHFWEEEMAHGERVAWERRFRDVGRRTLEALQEGELTPAEAAATRPYAIRHYGAHLESRDEIVAVEPEEAYALVAESWMRTWERLDGTYDGFLRDVDVAWRAADEKGHIGVQVKCSLCRSSVATLSARMPPALLSQLLQASMLTPRQALAIIKQRTDEEKQVTALAESVPYLAKGLLQETLTAARGIEVEWGRARVLAELVPHLPEGVLPQALEVARGLEEEGRRAWVLGKLAPYLPEELLEEALVAARGIEEKRGRARALAELAPRLGEEVREGALEEALAAVRGIEEPHQQARVLAGLASRLPERLLKEVLEMARSIEDRGWRAQALADLVPCLPEATQEETVEEALEVARSIEDRGWRAQALADLVPCLPEATQEETVEEALAAARGSEKDWRQVWAMKNLVPYLPVELLEEALAVAQAIADEQLRAELLAELASSLPKRLLSEALATARVMEQARWRAWTLTELAVRLPEGEREEVLGEALAAAKRIEDGRVRTRILAKLAPHLPEKLLGEVLAAARAIENEQRRMETLAELVPHLPEREQAELLGEALIVWRRIGDKTMRALALSGLVEYLSNPSNSLLAAALRAVQRIEEDPWRTWVLAQLTPHLPKRLIAEALAAASASEDKEWRVELLTKLASRLSEGEQIELLEEALVEAQEIEDEPARALALARFVPKLPEGVLLAARRIEDERSRAGLLIDLAPHLAEGERAEVWGEALAAAQGIEDDRQRALALARLAAPLPGEVLVAVSGIEDKWAQGWVLAGLVQHLPGRLLDEALAVVRRVEDTNWRVVALASLAPRLADEEREEALKEVLAAQTAQPLEEKYWRMAMQRLAPHVPARLLEEALTAGRIEDERRRAELLVALVPLLAEDLLAEVMAMAREIKEGQWRARLLGELAPRLPKGKREGVLRDALGAAREIEEERLRAQVLSDLVPRLPEQLLEEALTAAREIEEAQWRVQVLLELAPRLLKEGRENVLGETLTTASEMMKGWGLLVPVSEKLTPELAQWARSDPAAAYEAWRTFLREHAATPRPAFLGDMKELHPFIAELAKLGRGEEEMAEIFRAIRDVGRWWP